MNDSDGKTVVPFTNGVTVETLPAKSEAEGDRASGEPAAARIPARADGRCRGI